MPTVQAGLARWENSKSTRSLWETHWQEVADLVMPTRAFTKFWTSGQKRNLRIYNETAPKAAQSLAAALHGLLVNPNTRWFALTIKNSDLPQETEVQGWLHYCTTVLLSIFNLPTSGFSTASFEVAQDLVGFGTGIQQIDEEARDGIRFMARSLSSFWIIEDDDGHPTDLFREVEMSARDAMTRFTGPRDTLPERIVKLAEDDRRSETLVKLLHWIYRREYGDPNAISPMRMPWGSLWIYPEKKEKVREGGMRRNPYVTPRWGKAAEEPYGRSPAMDVLPGIKTVNAMTKTILEAGEYAVRPPIMVPANSIQGPISTYPGQIIYLRSGSRDFPQPLNSGARPDLGEKLLEMRERSIEGAFFLDAMRLPELDRMTAEEVITRRQQGLLLASPILSRLYVEWLNPTIQRTFSWAWRHGLLPPPPAGIYGGSVDIEYQSPMAQSQRASEAMSFTASMQTAAPLLAIDPTILLRNVDPDATLRRILILNNFDPRLLRPLTQTKQIVAQQEQTLQAQQTAQIGAEAAKGISAMRK